MDNFIRLYDIYTSCTRWNVIKQAHGRASSLKKIILWSCMIALVPLVPTSILTDAPILSWLIIALFTIYFVTFHYAKKDSYHLLETAHSRRVKLFSGNHQYIRYEEFKEKCQREGLVADIDESLRFVDYELGLSQTERVSAQPVLGLQIGLILAILGGAAGQWDTILTVRVIAILVVSAYFTYAVLDALKGSQPGMGEFKKFLLWVREERSRSHPLQDPLGNVQSVMTMKNNVSASYDESLG